MSKVCTNINLDSNLKKASQELFSSLGINLSTAITIFLKQSLKVHGLPFDVTIDEPNNETIKALNEYNEMKTNSQKYKRYATFQDALNSECHIQPNWLLIYRIDQDELSLMLFRTGSHSDLFK